LAGKARPPPPRYIKGRWRAQVFWKDDQPPETSPPGEWLALRCWIEAVLRLHGAMVARISVEPSPSVRRGEKRGS
jgi:hypothetical protein